LDKEKSQKPNPKLQTEKWQGQLQILDWRFEKGIDGEPPPM
jgi:hypothetical protein